MAAQLLGAVAVGECFKIGGYFYRVEAAGSGHVLCSPAAKTADRCRRRRPRGLDSSSVWLTPDQVVETN